MFFYLKTIKKKKKRCTQGALQHSERVKERERANEGDRVIERKRKKRPSMSRTYATSGDTSARLTAIAKLDDFFSSFPLPIPGFISPDVYSACARRRLPSTLLTERARISYRPLNIWPFVHIIIISRKRGARASLYYFSAYIKGHFFFFSFLFVLYNITKKW